MVDMSSGNHRFSLDILKCYELLAAEGYLSGQPLEEEERSSDMDQGGGVQVSAHYPKGVPMKAWAGQVANRDASEAERHYGSEVQDVRVQEIQSEDESPSHQLEADTRYLPLHSDLNASPIRPFNLSQLADQRPLSAPETSDQGFIAGQGDIRPVSAMEGHRSRAHHSEESKYEQYENRPIKPLNQNKKIAAKFGSSPKSSPTSSKVTPTISDSRPQSHCRRRSKSPLAKGRDFNQEEQPLPADSTEVIQQLYKAFRADKLAGKSGDLKSRTPESNKSQYTPERYTSPRRRSRAEEGHKDILQQMQQDFANVGVLSAEHPAYRGLDSGEVLQAAEQAEPIEVSEEVAAKKIQSFWRGFLARNKDLQALRGRHEIRYQRAKEYIDHLTEEVERQKQLYSQEKQLRALHLEVLRFLWKHVQSLQSWKEQVLKSQDSSLPKSSLQGEELDLRSTEQLVQTLEKASLHCAAKEVVSSANSAPPPFSRRPTRSAASPKSSASMIPKPDFSPQTSQKEIELGRACESLQKQVSQLQEVLGSVSNYIFQGGIISAEKDELGGQDSIKLSTDFEEEAVQGLGGEAACAPQARPSTTPDYILPGIPLAPENLRAQTYSKNGVVLMWTPSIILNAQAKQINKPILGYRIYVNDQPKGLVAGTQSKALLESLEENTLYRIFIRAVAALGESPKSNVVLFELGKKGSDIRVSEFQEDLDDNGDPSGSQGKYSGAQGSSGGYFLGGSGGGGGGSSHEGPPAPDLGGASPPGSTKAVLSEDDVGRRQSALKGSGLPSPSSPKSKSVHFDLDISPTRDRVESNKSCPSFMSSPSKEKTKNYALHGELGERAEPEVSQSLGEMRRSKRTTVVERLEQKSSNKSAEHEDTKPASPKTVTIQTSERTVSSSPKIKEGLVMKLEMTKEKGMLGEIKKSAKIHKRKPQPDASSPFKVVPDSSHGAREPEPSPRIPSSPEPNARRSSDSKMDESRHSAMKIATSLARSTSLLTPSESLVSPRITPSSPKFGGSEKRREAVRKSLELKSELKSFNADRDKAREESRRSSGLRRSESAGSVRRRHPSSGSEIDAEDGVKDKSSSGEMHLNGRELARQIALKSQRSKRASPASFIEDDKASSSASNSPPSTLDKGDDDKTDSQPQLLSDDSLLSREPSMDISPAPSLSTDVDKNLSSDNEKQETPIARHSRGRHSARELRSPRKKDRESKAERRASSMGAVSHKNKGEGQVVTNKPPMGRTPSTETVPQDGSKHRSPSLRASPRDDATRRQGRRRTKSEQGTQWSSGDDSGIEQRRNSGLESGSDKSDKEGSGDMTPHVKPRIDKGAEGDGRKSSRKKTFTHRRSASDLAGIQCLPDRPESPILRDKKPMPPNTPKHAMSSPRVRRSSSFSKGTTGESSKKDESSLLRQCISLSPRDPPQLSRERDNPTWATTRQYLTQDTLKKAAKSESQRKSQASNENEAANDVTSESPRTVQPNPRAIVRSSIDKVKRQSLGEDGDMAFLAGMPEKQPLTMELVKQTFKTRKNSRAESSPVAIRSPRDGGAVARSPRDPVRTRDTFTFESQSPTDGNTYVIKREHSQRVKSPSRDAVRSHDTDTPREKSSVAAKLELHGLAAREATSPSKLKTYAAVLPQKRTQQSDETELVVRRSESMRDDVLRAGRRQDTPTHSKGPVTMDDLATCKPVMTGSDKDNDKTCRRIKLGSKAADLFAKLQMKLSSSSRK